jgi:hypothetical protein
MYLIAISNRFVKDYFNIFRYFEDINFYTQAA